MTVQTMDKANACALRWCATSHLAAHATQHKFHHSKNSFPRPLYSSHAQSFGHWSCHQCVSRVVKYKGFLWSRSGSSKPVVPKTCPSAPRHAELIHRMLCRAQLCNQIARRSTVDVTVRHTENQQTSNTGQQRFHICPCCCARKCS